jgi:flagellar biosynthetic protein FliQ
MSEGMVIDLWRGALTTILAVAAPFVLAALVVGLLTAIFQAATQLQESVISFVPKLLAIALVLTTCGPWVLERLVHYAEGAMTTMARAGQVRR